MARLRSHAFSVKRALALCLASVACGHAAQAADEWQLLEEHWYTVELAGARAGSMVERVEDDGERYRTAMEVRMSLKRDQVSATIEITSTFVESHDGRLLVLEYVQNMGLQSVDTEWRFEADKVVQTTRQGMRELVREHPLPEGEWLTPRAAHRYWLKRREAAAQEITFRMISPEAGIDPVTITQKLLGEDTYELGDRTIPVTVWQTTTDFMPRPAREMYSSDGHLVFQEISAGFGPMVTRIATRAEAQGVEAGEAPEILVSTFVKPDKPIPDAVRSTTATLRLRVNEGTMPAIPSAGAQRVTPAADGAVTLSIDINDSQPATAAESADPAYLDSTAMVDGEDPVIRALAAKALRGVGDDPMDRAEAMRAFVGRFVSDKGLDTAFATASETAQMQTGDCSEHAVLLCAMLRAEGIPARVAIGLIYVDSFLGRDAIFGWHMWTQALIDGRWVDLDAVLDTRYHAGHVLTGTSGLGGGGLTPELATSITLIGNLRIEVVDMGYE
jgi:transglutaminase-like putative cysteine protease